MAWLRLTLITTAEVVDAVVALLERFSAEAISVSAASDEVIFAEGMAGREQSRYWQQSQISALLDAELALDIVIASLRNLAGEENLLQHHIDIVPDKDWLAASRSAHGALVVCASARAGICPRPLI